MVKWHHSFFGIQLRHQCQIHCTVIVMCRWTTWNWVDIVWSTGGGRIQTFDVTAAKQCIWRDDTLDWRRQTLDVSNRQWTRYSNILLLSHSIVPLIV